MKVESKTRVELQINHQKVQRVYLLDHDARGLFDRTSTNATLLTLVFRRHWWEYHVEEIEVGRRGGTKSAGGGEGCE
jgi:hypothetical protein